MKQDFTLKAYKYHLPPENIAQKPAEKRDHSRLLVLNNVTKEISHQQFTDITSYIDDGDMLVLNDTRVFPARLLGKKVTGGKVEVFLLHFPTVTSNPGEAECEVLIKSSKRPKIGTLLHLGPNLSCRVTELLDNGGARVLLHFESTKELSEILKECGQVPLPPYIERQGGTTDNDTARYQTVYANEPGAVAAPTAGLHFTAGLLKELQRRQINLGTVTLHVGYGTFAPVRSEQIQEHKIHREYCVIPQETVDQINQTKKQGGKIWAVGTTTVRTLEYGARNGTLKPMEGWCDLYIYPGFTFRVIDNLITNFHLPESSLMFLVSALCGRDTLLNCYQQAIEKGYRFYSYGDAMAIVIP